jgi:hypothetical protein
MASVVTMAAFVLFGADTAAVSLDRDSLTSPLSISAPALPLPSQLLPFAR